MDEQAYQVPSKRYAVGLSFSVVTVLANGRLVELDPTVDFVAGTVSGIAGLVVGYPFDTVKVRFQTPERASKYRSTFHAISTIAREERVLGLYKGITSPLATAAFMNGIVFSSYRFLLKSQHHGGMELDQRRVPSLVQVAIAGAGSGVIASFITTPVELVKIKQQESLTPTSTRKVAWKIYQDYGIRRGLYRGLTATALRDVGYGAYFFGYEATCRLLTSSPYQDRAAPHHLLLAAAVAGIAGWVFTFPMDVVKTRIQASEPSPRGTYNTVISTVIRSYREEGLRVFFRGLSPTLIRAIPVNMATFTVFEALVHHLS